MILKSDLRNPGLYEVIVFDILVAVVDCVLLTHYNVHLHSTSCRFVVRATAIHESSITYI